MRGSAEPRARRRGRATSGRSERELNTASLDDIRAGKVTDVYFDRAIAVLKGVGVDKAVTMEVTCSSFPEGYEHGVLVGLDEVAAVAEGLDVEIEGQPITKRGKRSGVKEVWVCEGCGARRVSLRGATPAACGCGGEWQALLRPFLREGRAWRTCPRRLRSASA